MLMASKYNDPHCGAQATPADIYDPRAQATPDHAPIDRQILCFHSVACCWSLR
jgi:hypothetical protein